jgi:hypothetical protein
VREHGTDLPDNNGNHPIHIAAQNGHASLVSLILRHRADVNAQNNNGQTPLHMAVAYDLDDVEEVLRNAGARGDIKNSSGFPADLGIDGDLEQRRALQAFQKAETTPDLIDALTRICSLGDGDTAKIAKFGLEKKRNLKPQWTPDVQTLFTAAVQGSGLPPGFGPPAPPPTLPIYEPAPMARAPSPVLPPSSLSMVETMDFDIYEPPPPPRQVPAEDYEVYSAPPPAQPVYYEPVPVPVARPAPPRPAPAPAPVRTPVPALFHAPPRPAPPPPRIPVSPPQTRAAPIPLSKRLVAPPAQPRPLLPPSPPPAPSEVALRPPRPRGPDPGPRSPRQQPPGTEVPFPKGPDLTKTLAYAYAQSVPSRFHQAALGPGTAMPPSASWLPPSASLVSPRDAWMPPSASLQPQQYYSPRPYNAQPISDSYLSPRGYPSYGGNPYAYPIRYEGPSANYAPPPSYQPAYRQPIRYNGGY